METILRAFDGVIFERWPPFYEALATGALFAYTAIMSCDTLIRIELLPEPAQELRPGTCKLIRVASLSFCIFSVMLFVLLFARHSVVSVYVHMCALVVAAASLCFILVTITLDDQSRKGINHSYASSGKLVRKEPHF
jgi:hypothetical protein